MTPAARVAVGILTLLLLGGAVAFRMTGREPVARAETDEVAMSRDAAAVATAAGTLLEFGSTRCAGCKAMHAELALLREACPTGPTITEIDVFNDEATADRYGVRVIPTQVFLDAEGEEFDRHQGFLPQAEILSRFGARSLACRQ